MQPPRRVPRRRAVALAVACLAGGGVASRAGAQLTASAFGVTIQVQPGTAPRALERVAVGSSYVFFDPVTSAQVEIEPTQVVIGTYPIGIVFPAGSFVGFHLFDATHTLPAFTSFTIDTTVYNTARGLDPRRLTFDADNLYVNLEGTVLSNLDRYVFAVGTATGPGTVVPEPGTWVMVAAGLLSVGGVAARRRAR